MGLLDLTAVSAVPLTVILALEATDVGAVDFDDTVEGQGSCTAWAPKQVRRGPGSGPCCRVSGRKDSIGR